MTGFASGSSGALRPGRNLPPCRSLPVSAGTLSNAPGRKGHQQAFRKGMQIGFVHFAQFDELLVSRLAALAGRAAFHEKVAYLRDLFRWEPILRRVRRRNP